MTDRITIPVTRFWPRFMALFWVVEGLLGLFFAGLGLAWIGKEEWFLIAALVLAGLFLALMGLVMLGATWATVVVKGPVIEMGTAGFLDRRISDQVIPWKDMRWGLFATGRGGTSLQFGVPPEVESSLNVKWGLRLMGKLNRLFRYPPLTVMTLGTGKSVRALADMMSEYRQPSY